MSPNPKSTQDPPKNPSTPGTSEWFYDEIMRHIEPDLLTTVIPTHAEKYNDETQEERVERMKAYDAAFAIFDKVAEEYEKEFMEDVQKLKKQSRSKVMKEEKKERKQELSNIEKIIDTPDAK